VTIFCMEQRELNSDMVDFCGSVCPVLAVNQLKNDQRVVLCV